MTIDESGSIVRSTTGRDKGRLYLVWQSEGDFLTLVDGDKRRVSKPKRKRRKHAVMLVMLEKKEFADIQSGCKDGSADSRIRRHLLRYKRSNTDKINE